MKNLILTILLILPVFAFSQDLNSTSKNTIAITSEKEAICIYEKKSTYSDCLVEVKKDSFVEIIESQNDLFYKVKFNNIIGFLEKKMTGNQNKAVQSPIVSKPPTYRPTYNTTRSSTYKTTSVICSGHTQKGTRCKNKTTNSSGRCHHHN